MVTSSPLLIANFGDEAGLKSPILYILYSKARYLNSHISLDFEDTKKLNTVLESLHE